MVGRVALVGEIRNAYEILVGSLKVSLFERYTRRW